MSALAIRFRRVQVEDFDVFYREAGRPDAPVLLLLHGFPTSSHMFRDLISVAGGSLPADRAGSAGLRSDLADFA